MTPNKKVKNKSDKKHAEDKKMKTQERLPENKAAPLAMEEKPKQPQSSRRKNDKKSRSRTKGEKRKDISQKRKEEAKKKEAAAKAPQVEKYEDFSPKSKMTECGLGYRPSVRPSDN